MLLQGTGTTSQILVSNYKTTGNVNMRTGGDVSYNIVQTVPTGATLLLTNFNSNGWGYTTYNGKSGWMSTYGKRRSISNKWNIYSYTTK